MLGGFGFRLRCVRRAAVIETDEGMNRISGSHWCSGCFGQRKTQPPTGGLLGLLPVRRAFRVLVLTGSLLALAGLSGSRGRGLGGTGDGPTPLLS